MQWAGELAILGFFEELVKRRVLSRMRPPVTTWLNPEYIAHLLGEHGHTYRTLHITSLLALGGHAMEGFGVLPIPCPFHELSEAVEVDIHCAANGDALNPTGFTPAPQGQRAGMVEVFGDGFGFT